MIWRIALCAVCGYLLGGFNGAIVISHLVLKDDVRSKGSGNAGLTNFLRNYGGWATFLVAAIDVAKTVAACLVGMWLLPADPTLGKMVAGAASQLGHIFPVFYHFHGGKGIVCAGALALMMDWRIFVILFGVFLIVFFITHYVSLGSVLAALGYAIAFPLFFGGKNLPVALLGVAVAAMALFMHRSNIVRLFQGRETKTYLKKSHREGA